MNPLVIALANYRQAERVLRTTVRDAFPAGTRIEVLLRRPISSEPTPVIVSDRRCNRADRLIVMLPNGHYCHVHCDMIADEYRPAPASCRPARPPLPAGTLDYSEPKP